MAELTYREAVARGIAITSGTITSAAAIMVTVFAVFVTLDLVIIKQLGFGLAVAVLLDATIVRSVLLPATMRLSRRGAGRRPVAVLIHRDRCGTIPWLAVRSAPP